MDRGDISSPEQADQTECIKIYNGLYKLHTLVELGHVFNGFVANDQNGVSYLENDSKQIALWRDRHSKSMCGTITILYPNQSIQTISDFEISNDGGQMSYVQTWPFGIPDEPGSNRPYETVDLGLRSCDKLKATLDELDEASKANKKSFLGRIAAKFANF